MLAKKTSRRQKIRYRIRHKISGTAQIPRLSVFRSNKDIYAQLIDDVAGITLCASSSRNKNLKELTGNKTDKAKEVGKLLAQQAFEKGIKKIAFDRGGYLYHGRVKALAEGAREGGLQF